MNSRFRTQRTLNKYKKYRKVHSKNLSTPFLDWEKRLIKEYKYWRIIKNNFPYDKIADIHHLLITKRVVPFQWSELTIQEKDELNEIKNELGQTYTKLMENFPSAQSVPNHFHLHLLKIPPDK